MQEAAQGPLDSAHYRGPGEQVTLFWTCTWWNLLCQHTQRSDEFRFLSVAVRTFWERRGSDRPWCGCKEGFPGDTVVKIPPAHAGDAGYMGSIPGLGGFPWGRPWWPTPGVLPGKFHGQRSLVGYSPWGPKELDTTEQLRAQTDVKKTREGGRVTQAGVSFTSLSDTSARSLRAWEVGKGHKAHSSVCDRSQERRKTQACSLWRMARWDVSVLTSIKRMIFQTGLHEIGGNGVPSCFKSLLGARTVTLCDSESLHTGSQHHSQYYLPDCGVCHCPGINANEFYKLCMRHCK